METYVRYLVSRQNSVCPVAVIVANDIPRTESEVLDGARIVRIASFGTLASQPLCPTLPWCLRGQDASIVHLHLPNPWACLAYLMGRQRGKLIITHHADTLGRPRLRRLVSPFVQSVMKRAAAIIVTSNRYLESSEELAPFHNKCHVVPLGIDLEEMETERGEEVRAVRSTYGPRLVLSVGRLVRYKGLEYLLRAMQSIDASLVLIGTGPLRKELEIAQTKLGLTNKIFLLGHVKDIVPYYKAAQLFVLPSVSRAEAFGFVQLEAMAAGLCVVNTDIASGVPEVSLHGITGATVPPADAKALAAAIGRLLDNPEIRTLYGQAASMRVRREFTVQQMAERTMEVYQSVL
jgi:glycosyltransferase involved in cell wall biosynthesis